MSKVKPKLFEVLNDAKVEAALSRLYKVALKQSLGNSFLFFAQSFQIAGKGS